MAECRRNFSTYGAPTDLAVKYKKALLLQKREKTKTKKRKRTGKKTKVVDKKEAAKMREKTAQTEKEERGTKNAFRYR